jgi:hypothetical protein
MWYLYTMEFYSTKKRMKFCCLQVNGWNWRTSSYKWSARFRRPKATCFLSYMDYEPNINTAILLKQAILRGGHIWENEGKTRELRQIWLMYSLYMNECRIFKPVETTIRD